MFFQLKEKNQEKVFFWRVNINVSSENVLRGEWLFWSISFPQPHGMPLVVHLKIWAAQIRASECLGSSLGLWLSCCCLGGQTFWMGGSEWAGLCSRLRDSFNLWSWDFTLEQSTLRVDEPSSLYRCSEGQFQSHGAFYSICISSCCTELSSVCASLSSFLAPHPSQPPDTYVSCWNFFSPSLQHSSSRAAFVCLQQVATEPEKCISCLTWFHPGVKRCSGSGSTPPFLTMWGEAEGFSSLHQFASFKSIKKKPRTTG